MGNLDDLKKKLTTNIPTINPVPSQPEVKPKPSNSGSISEQDRFEEFKSKVLERIKTDKSLIKLRLKTHVSGTKLIIFQGVRVNILARFNMGKTFVISRSIIRKKLGDIIEDYY